MNIVFYGGTFDPPNNGHIEICKHLANIDASVIFISPSFNPHKTTATSAHHRSAMVKELVTNLNDEFSPKKNLFQFYSKEIQSTKPTYTIDTLRDIQNKYSPTTLYVAIGADQYLSFTSWKEYENILSLAHLIVFHRPTYDISNYHLPTKNISFVKIHVPISSSEIREQIKIKKDISENIPTYTNTYIQKHFLYQ